MNTKVIIYVDQDHPLIPKDGKKDAISRLKKFVTWLNKNNDGDWIKPDLDAYRDHLLSEGLSPASIQAHLSSIRGQYKRLLDNRELFFQALPNKILKNPFYKQKAYVDEMIARLNGKLNMGKIKVTKKQDRADSEHLRLTAEQGNTLMRKPGKDTLLGLRNTAIIALMLATGIREQELCDLKVDDLRQRLDGELALRISKGKGKKQRMVIYGDDHIVLLTVDNWLQRAGIAEGVVFRGIDQYGDRGLMVKQLTTRTVQRILEKYPIVIDGRLTQVRPHDLRRTYARREYEGGMPLPALQQNLGHEKVETTLGYIGPLDVKTRRGKAIFDFNL